MLTKRAAAPFSHKDLAAPTSKARAFNDPHWVWELKHDGYRALLLKEGREVRLLTRKGNNLMAFFPEVAADLRKLPDIALDGELVMLDAQGRPEFHQLRGRCAIRDPKRVARAAVSKPAAVFVFDVLGLEGKDLRALPLLKRKALLQKRLQGLDRLVYCQHIGENGEKLLQAADQLGLEGVIGKKADSPYPRGRTPLWIKVKTAHGRHIDADRAKWDAA